MSLHAFFSEDKIETYELPEQRNEEMVRRIINKTDNPHPIVLMCVVAVVIILLYYIYIMMIKESFSGEWFDGLELINIEHNKWNDTILVNNHIRGNVRGNAIYLERGNKIQVGVLYKKSIYWVGSDTIWIIPSSVV